MTPTKNFPETYWNHKKLSRRERTALRDAAAYILQPEQGRGRAVCACGHVGKGTEAVALVLRKDGTAGTHGTLRCGSPWLCADCAPLKANQRLDRLQGLADALVTANGKMASVTITVSHDRSSRLRDIKRAIETASRKARQGAPWNRQKILHDIIGVLSAPEVTYSLRHGWHFHIHHAFLTGETGNPAELGNWFLQRYLSYLKKAGFTADIQGQEVSLVLKPNDYIRYLRKGVGRARNDIWNLHNKGRPPGKHLYPFDILQKASGCSEMKMLWHEYAEAMPGTRSCVITRSIATRLNIRHDDDGAEIDHGRISGHLPASVWTSLVNRRKTNLVLSALEDKGATAWSQIASIACALAFGTKEDKPEATSSQEDIAISCLEHRPSATQIADLALHLKWHLNGKDRNGSAIRLALDQERGQAIASGMIFVPPNMKEVFSEYARDGIS